MNNQARPQSTDGTLSGRITRFLALLAGVIWSAQLLNASTDGLAVFGPEVFLRETGKPKAISRSFSVDDPDAAYLVLVKNGETDGSNRISSANIKLNSSFIVRPNDLNQNVAGLKIPTSLSPRNKNKLKVKLASKPGSYLTITICLIDEHYVIEDDGNYESCAAGPGNTPPAADAGPDQTALIGESVSLDASASTDVDGDPLTYAWILQSVPPGSGATLSDPNAITPMFSVDQPGEYIAELVVNDGTADSAPDTVAIDTLNSPPVANAGTDQTVFVTDVVVLDGGDSLDVDGDPLTYNWTLDSVPVDSTATLDNPNILNPSFVADLPGNYIAELIVNDAQIDSAADSVTIATQNSRPVAHAGDDQSVTTGDPVSLSASQSSDVDGDPLSYAWSLLSTPTDSNPVLSDTTAENPNFVGDKDGMYVAQLIVNDGNEDSAPDTTVITASTANQAPVAVASADALNVAIGTQVNLDGGSSSDPEEDPLSYGWSLLTPDGSTATLSSSTSITPGFTPDVIGSYVVTLIVNDGSLPSLPASVTISAGVANNPPDLITVGNRSIAVGQNYTTRLFAVDPDAGDVLTFSLLEAPAGMNINDTTGDLQWTPTAAQLGVNPVKATVADAGGLSDIEDFSVDVHQPLVAPPTNAPPELDPLSDQSVTLGDALSIQAMAVDPDAGDGITFSLPLAPAGMTIDPNSGEIQWAPAAGQTGHHDVAVQATDNGGLVDVTNLVVAVNTVNAPPAANDDLYSVHIDETLTVIAPGVLLNDSDPDNDPLTAWLVTPPDHGILDFNGDGSFEYTPVPPPPPPLGEPTLKWESVTVGHAVAQPLVLDLNRDGNPEVVALTQNEAGSARRLQAVSGQDGTVVFDVDLFQPDPIVPSIVACRSTGCQIAAADVDLDGFPEILVIDGDDGSASNNDSERRSFYIFEHDGSYKLTSVDLYSDPLIDSTAGFTKLAIANVLGDEHPETIVGYRASGPTTNNNSDDFVTVYDHLGNIVWTARGSTFDEGLSPGSGYVAVADIDLDGDMEILYGDDVYDHLGSLLFSQNLRVREVLPVNLDNDAFAELIYRDTSNTLRAFNHDGTLLWGPVNLTSFSGLGPIAVGDPDNDGMAEILIAGTRGVRIIHHDGTLGWETFVDGEVAQSGFPTVFDLNGDGENEVIYHAALGLFDTGDKGTLYILNGETGAILHTVAAPRHTRSQNDDVGPIVADVDNDGAAEIVLSRISSGLTYDPGVIRVFEAPLDNWAPTRKIWNQHAYHVTNIAADGTVPVQEPINWLLNGLNNYRVNVPLPEEVPPTLETFSYHANDGALNSNDAIVTLNLLPPGNPPVFLTHPDDKTTLGFPYQYAPIVFDPDFGDISNFSLTSAPAGMTIDPGTGVVNWMPVAVETVAVGIAVTDTQGFTALQRYALAVGLPVTVPDVVGDSQANAETTIDSANLLVGAILSGFDPVAPAGSVTSQSPVAGTVAEFGASVNLGVSTGPGPGDVDDDLDGFTENQGDCNDVPGVGHTIFPGANDPAGDGIDQDCDGIDGNLSIAEILVGPASSTILVGQQVGLEATAIFDDGTSQDVTELVTWSNGSNVFTGGSAGGFPITATLGANAGNANVSVVATTVDAVAPQAEITAPVTNSTITQPVDIIGTATDANFLKYELAVTPVGESNFTLINTSTTAVNAGVLGQFDPTLLLNDLYTLRLSVFDRGGNVTVDQVAYQVDEQMKVGNFTLRFTDLSIPMSGIPITVTRLYDSRDKRMGDFGVGWQLDVQSLICRANRILGTGWQVVSAGLSFALVPTDDHKVSLTLPGGRVEEFDLVVSPTVSPLVPFPPFANRASFKARPGTLGTLTSLENNNLTILDAQPGVIELLDDSSNETYNPQRFRYTATDGSEIIIHKTNGVESITEPNGNSLSFGPGGITHSAGKSVVFNRDAQGRISSITDPAGKAQTYRYDTNGDLTGHTDAETNTTRFFYDSSHGLIRMEDPLGNQAVRNEFDASGRLLATIDADGNRIEFDHDIVGRQETQTDTRGNSQVLIYDDSGNVLSREWVVTIEGVPTLARETFEYDAAGNQTVQVNADGQRTELAYDNHDNVIQSVVDAGGLNIVTNTTFDERDNPLTQTDALNNVTEFRYNAAGNPSEVIDPLGNTTRFTYDDAGRIVVREDALGTRTLNEYSASGQILSQEKQDANGNIASRGEFSYDSNNNVLTETAFKRVAGTLTPFTTTHSYDANNRRVSTADPMNNTNRVEYDSVGNVTASIDASENRTDFTYNGRGMLTRTDFADSSFTRNEYDPTGNRTKQIDQLGREIQFVYDELNRRVSTVAPDLSSSRSVFTAAGLLLASIDANNQRTDYQYDTAGRRTRTLLPEVLDGVTGTLVRPERVEEFDATGRATAVTDANGNRTAFSYDDLGRLGRTTFPDLSFREQTYDGLGRVTTKTDAEGRITSFDYDAQGKLLAVTQPPPNAGDTAPVTSYSYDERGNRLSQRDAQGKTTRFEYDSLNRQIRRTLPGGQFETYTYDSNSLVETFTDFNGNILSFEYDALNRVTARRFPDGSAETVTYTPTGTRETISDARGTTIFAYDVNNRLELVQHPDAQTIAYTYDERGAIEMVTTNGSVSAIYQYDAIGRLSGVIGPQGQTLYGYDPAGNRVKTIAPNGVETNTQIDSLNRVASLFHRDPGALLLESFEYTYTAAGMRATSTEADGSVESYSYDNLNRLVNEIRSGANPRELSYEYDPVGNRTRLLRNGTDETLYTYDSNDRMLHGAATSYTYDANGNRSSKMDGGGVVTYQWDFKNKLVAVTAPGGTVTYTYDADGNRISKASATGVANYLVDGQSVTGFAQVIEERDQTNATIASYTYGRDLLSQNRLGTARFFQYDAHGSTQLLTDVVGTITDSYDYDGYGETAAQSGVTDNDYLYSGEQRDDETGDYYLRARYYDPEAGVFLSRDPFQGKTGNPISLQPYPYAGANPINFADPSGEFTLPEISIASSIQTGMKTVNFLSKTAKFCRAKGALTAIKAAGFLTQLTIGLANNLGKPTQKREGKFVQELDFSPPLRLGDTTLDKFAFELATIGTPIQQVNVKLGLEGKGPNTADAQFELSKSEIRVKGTLGSTLVDETIFEIRACEVITAFEASYVVSVSNSVAVTASNATLGAGFNSELKNVIALSAGLGPLSLDQELPVGSLKSSEKGITGELFGIDLIDTTKGN